MKIWMDILTPKQLLLFTSIAKRLKDIGHDLLLTSRRYVQLDELIDSIYKGYDIIRVGEWGGKGLAGKLTASIERMKPLLKQVLSQNPDLCISSGSPEAARIAYGLRIPHFLISDTPHSPVNRLTAPLSEQVLTPWVIPFREWVEAGADRRRIARYKALDPCFWLRELKPDEKVLEELALEKRRYILFRMPETKAAYLDARDESFVKLLMRLGEMADELEIVALCRYREQAELARRLLGDKVKVVDRLIPGPSLTAYSALFIGGGGTMTQEAALLGVPAISVYPGKLPTVLRFLEKRRLVVYCSNMSDVKEELGKMLDDLEKVRRLWEKRSERLWKVMEDPFQVVLEKVEVLS